jgi:hypothetical protein
MFIKPKIEQVRYRQYDLKNNPVNIDLCKELVKSTYAHYPDNEGIPSIIFKGCDAEWKFIDEKDRDEEYERIILFTSDKNNITNCSCQTRIPKWEWEKHKRDCPIWKNGRIEELERALDIVLMVCEFCVPSSPDLSEYKKLVNKED